MARRGAGEGYVRQRGNSFFGIYRPYPGAEQVSAKLGSERDGMTEAEAERELATLIAEARAPSKQEAGSQTTLEEASLDWLEWVKETRPDLSAKVLQSYETALYSHLIPAMGADAIGDITPRLIEQYLTRKASFAPGHPKAIPVKGKVASKRNKPLGPDALRKQITVLRGVFWLAQREGIVQTNPVDQIKFPLKSKKRRVKPLEREEVKALLEEVKDQAGRLMIRLMGSLGLRIGER